ncbi:xylan glycosyltransferase MUCI21-like [Wolffia australiana]
MKEMEKGKHRSLLAFLVILMASCILIAPFFIYGGSSSPILPLCSHLTAEPVQSPLPAVSAKVEHQNETSAPPPPRLETSLTCDRSGFSSDVCVLRGVVHLNPSSSSVNLASDGGSVPPQLETIRPYTRKWDKRLTQSIKELKLSLNGADTKACDVIYPVPAVIFSIGGFTGNIYHAFNDALIPLFITSHKFQRRVVFIILEYQTWWLNKYKHIISELSDYPPVDFYRDNLTSCFPEVTVGLKVHGDLTINPSPDLTVQSFRRMLDDAYRHVPGPLQPAAENGKPKVVIIFRQGTRAVENEQEVVQLCESVGFQVEILRPTITMDMVEIYRVINSSDAMIGVVGAAMTHLLFQKPGDVFIQVVLLGTRWAAETSYGEPAKKMGLKYMPYTIKTEESSLSRQYPKEDPVLTDPDSVNKKGWDVAAKVYLQQQAVSIDVNRFRKTVTNAYKYIVARKRSI